jgi:hypothetical protein
MDQSIDVTGIKREVVAAFREIDPSEFALKLGFDGEPLKTPEGNNRTARARAFRGIRWDFLNRLHEADDPESVRFQIDELEVPRHFTRDYTDIKLFSDMWEIDVTNKKYGFSFLLSCYAIIWGIKRYHQIKQGRDMASHNQAILEGKV